MYMVTQTSIYWRPRSPSTAGKLPYGQTGNGGTHRRSASKWIYLDYVPIGKRLCENLWGTSHRVPKNAITELWGEQVALALYDRWGVVSKENFPIVYWEGMEHVMKLFPEMFRIWVTKHASHFQGTNQQLSSIDKLVLNVCPCCNCHDKSMSHITWCRDPERTCILKDLVEQLVKWLYDQQTDGKVVQLFKRDLLAGGTCILALLLKPNSRLGVEAQFHDHLGWDCFL